MPRRRAFSIVELLVVISIITLLITMILSAIARTRETAKRTQCASNLRSLGQALMMYAIENKGSLPRTVMGPGPLEAFTNPASPEPFKGVASTAIPGAGDGSTRPADNDVTASIFLLIRLQRVTPHVFVCPSSLISTEPDSLNGQPTYNRSNFSHPYNLGYSIALPYPDDAGGAGNYKWKILGKADFALMSDLNPGVAVAEMFPSSQDAVWDQGFGPADAFAAAGVLRRANSNNHQKAGQNVLYADGHVSFHTTAFCGPDGDNIYSLAGPAGGPPNMTLTSDSNDFRAPAFWGDCIMLPTDDIIPSLSTPEQRKGTVNWGP